MIVDINFWIGFCTGGALFTFCAALALLPDAWKRLLPESSLARSRRQTAEKMGILILSVSDETLRATLMMKAKESDPRLYRELKDYLYEMRIIKP